MTEHIRMFLAFNFSDERLAALLAHAESGKLGYISCCCLVGAATARHPLQTAVPLGELTPKCEGDEHLAEARELPFADEAEYEFRYMASSDKRRCELVIPIIRDEFERREKARGKLCDEFLESIEKEVIS